MVSCMVLRRHFQLQRVKSIRKLTPVILFLNGPFGVGKTTVAHILVEKLPHAMLYNPEEVGDFVRQLIMPVEQADDFQDFALWRTLVVEVARHLRERYSRTLVIPMTIWHRQYFETITDGLRRIDSDLNCFRLTASKDIVESRILARPDSEGPHEWCLAHLESGLAASRDPAFGIEVQTDGCTPIDVAQTIIDLLAVRSEPNE